MNLLIFIYEVYLFKLTYNSDSCNVLSSEKLQNYSIAFHENNTFCNNIFCYGTTYLQYMNKTTSFTVIRKNFSLKEVRFLCKQANFDDLNVDAWILNRSFFFF